MNAKISRYWRIGSLTRSFRSRILNLAIRMLIAKALILATSARSEVPVLTYHPRFEAGNDYSNNELIAFQEDLRLINELGYLVIPAAWLVEWYLGGRDIPEHSLVITFDDGADATLAFLEALADFSDEVGADQPYLHVTTFVIASPLARADITGGADMDESWWRRAEASPLMSIENHSWDHNHPAVGVKCDEFGVDEHNFVGIDSFSKATCEIPLATMYIQSLTGRKPTLFAYPYGESSDYLRDDYLPNFKTHHELLAAFGTYQGRVTLDSPRWNLPRYVHRWHWKTPEQLRVLLGH